jgi:trehalose/maltose hydrolase-like predicted phosphorylase
MAVFTLRQALALAEAGRGSPVDESERARWREIADRMLILHTPAGLIEQHEGFLSLPLADDAVERPELAWQRDRMEWRDVKQADVVMLMAVLEPDHPEAERRANYELYEPLTRHLSSLSDAIHSLVAVRAGLAGDGDRYRRRAVAIDLRDSRGNCAEGLHLATQGGVWQAVVLGVGGLRSDRDGLRLDPRLPASWSRLEFRCSHAGTPVRVRIEPQRLVVEHDGGDSIPVLLPGLSATTCDGRLELALAPAGWAEAR